MEKLTNKVVVKRFFLEIYNNHNYEAAYRYFTSDYRDNGPDRAVGCKAAIEVFKKTHNSFPNLNVTIGDLIEENGKVTFRGHFTATHLGEFEGIAPSGKKVSFEAIEIFRLVNGKIAESWGYWPMITILAQLQIE